MRTTRTLTALRLTSPSEMHSSDSHIAGRLQAFSDVVIGFALAQTGVNLVIPDRAEAVLGHPFGLFAFLLTFMVVCLLWWGHTRVMRFYFRPTPVMIFLTFAFLASILLFVYTLQISLHLGSLASFRLYFGAQAVTFGLEAAMNGYGARLRWNDLTPELRHAGIARAVRNGLVVVGTVVGLSLQPPSLTTMIGGVLAGALAGRLAGIVYVRATVKRASEPNA